MDVRQARELCKYAMTPAKYFSHIICVMTELRATKAGLLTLSCKSTYCLTEGESHC